MDRTCSFFGSGLFVLLYFYTRTEDTTLSEVNDSMPPETSAAPPAPDGRGLLSLRVAICGFGTVGSSVARILADSKPAGLVLTHVFNRGVERKRVHWTGPHVVWTDNVDAVLQSDADVIVELVGGLDPAGSWARRALEAGKSVVTANKKLI